MTTVIAVPLLDSRLIWRDRGVILLCRDEVCEALLMEVGGVLDTPAHNLGLFSLNEEMFSI